ncbi:MAG: MFS transporter [Bacteroidota bacterium]
MLAKLTKPYTGLSSEVWILALITLINRAGAMVIPFLALYLTKKLDFSLVQVGWIMSTYGIGSVVGTFLGGKYTDKIGYYKIMYRSLFSTGIVFIAIQFLTDFYLICLGIFVLSVVADIFRPAMWVALSAYSKEENRTRSVTLIRLAINLGFSMGPALGGFIIAGLGYNGLFWVDGITCIIAAFMMLNLLYQKTPEQTKEDNKDEKKLSPYRDKQFIIFWFSIFLIGFGFMQYFSTMPLFYNKMMGLDEQNIGWLLALNGFFIFLTEMPIVHYLERKKINKINIVIYGNILFILSFMVLNMTSWVGITIVGMLLMTFGEILGFPFSNSYALDRAKKGNQGSYMAFYSISFSTAYILGPNIGMQLTDNYGFKITWYVMGILIFISIFLLLWLKRLVKINS